VRQLGERLLRTQIVISGGDIRRKIVERHGDPRGNSRGFEIDGQDHGYRAGGVLAGVEDNRFDDAPWIDQLDKGRGIPVLVAAGFSSNRRVVVEQRHLISAARARIEPMQPRGHPLRRLPSHQQLRIDECPIDGIREGIYQSAGGRRRHGCIVAET
jgi:hypothetical protein